MVENITVRMSFIVKAGHLLLEKDGVSGATGAQAAARIVGEEDPGMAMTTLLWAMPGEMLRVATRNGRRVTVAEVLGGASAEEAAEWFDSIGS